MAERSQVWLTLTYTLASVYPVGYLGMVKTVDGSFFFSFFFFKILFMYLRKQDYK